MNFNQTVQWHIEKDQLQLNKVLAEWIIDYITQVLKKQDRFTWALSGGNTPKQLYELLAQPAFREKMPWNKLHIFFGDERHVPFDDPNNNGRMAFNALLKAVPVPPEQIHYIRTDVPPAKSASGYETILHTYFDPLKYSFDLVLLGMGDDGHTLSLFPGSEIIYEKEHWVKSLYSSDHQQYRITLTPAIVNRAARIAFLATGQQKSAVLKKVLQGSYEPEKFPAQIIQPQSGNTDWFMDEAAAGLL
ncbi:MAG TPA: 6-phosphogluconolactonase [Chitinophagales bacterium]|nr:6-phosphogluconolactonase [Chitinophagales bacterium]